MPLPDGCRESGGVESETWALGNPPHRIGPSLRIDAQGRLLARDKTLLVVPVGQWVHFEIVYGLGTKATGTYDLTVILPGQSPRRFEKLPCDPQCRELEWLGFVSVGSDPSVFYLDNLKLGPKR